MERRLAAILIADVVGYSRLMAEVAVPRNLFRKILWRIDDQRQSDVVSDAPSGPTQAAKPG